MALVVLRLGNQEALTWEGGVPQSSYRDKSWNSIMASIIVSLITKVGRAPEPGSGFGPGLDSCFYGVRSTPYHYSMFYFVCTEHLARYLLLAIPRLFEIPAVHASNRPARASMVCPRGL